MREYLVGTNESSAEGSKNFNNSWTAVASDSIVRSNLGHVGLPANILPHYNSQVCYKECIFVQLGKKDTYMWINQKVKKTQYLFSIYKLHVVAVRPLTRVCS